MCGIAGLWHRGSAFTAAGLEDIAQRMTRALAHRGPDAQGTWASPSNGLVLGHRRLSILDLSPAGAQPMRSASGRFVIVFNGEIYDHLALRRALPAQSWRGHSDTETLLAAIAHWGLPKALQRCAGMFALALWDSETCTLSLARDRLGEKPLYYGRIGGDFVFGSELKALRHHPAYQGGVDRGALAALFSRGFIGAPRTIHPGLSKLPPGTVLSIRENPNDADTAMPSPFWALREVVEARRLDTAPSAAEAVDQLADLLHTVVGEQVVADVPVGAFLSGGIDSSLVVAAMKQVSTQPVRTFTIGFPSRKHDETEYARRVARHLGTVHTELQLTDAQVLELVPKMTSWFDEPFGDSSALPTYLVSMLARRHVTVCLSGDGGDEMFAGYSRYARLAANWSRLQRWPGAWRRASARLGALGVAPRRARQTLHLAGSRNGGEFYARMVSQWLPYTGVVKDVEMPTDVITLPQSLDDSPIEGAMYADALAYLPDDILTKVDRTAMANSLEVRIPLLDRRIVEWAWQLPIDIRRHDGVAKWPLRTLLARHLPVELIDRPKMGFGVPLDEWLRTSLRPWAEDLLDERRLRREGFLEPRAVRAAWQQHLARKADLRDVLWPALMFQQWLADGLANPAA
ncbi:MAG: asparagine synthase (glutamine-hydrolyzing) [Rubrivivax sp.]|nr:asparagine synthase (glutamine-hydrolyzing) [Rubrivivax sp.]